MSLRGQYGRAGIRHGRPPRDAGRDVGPDDRAPAGLALPGEAREESSSWCSAASNTSARSVCTNAAWVRAAVHRRIDALVQQRFIRKKFKDPMTEDGEFQPLYLGANTNPTNPVPLLVAGANLRSRRAPPSTGVGRGSQGGQQFGAGGIIGVVSKSKETSIRTYNGRTRYNEWMFVYAGQRGMPGGPGGPGGQPRPGPSRCRARRSRRPRRSRDADPARRPRRPRTAAVGAEVRSRSSAKPGGNSPFVVHRPLRRGTSG